MTRHWVSSTGDAQSSTGLSLSDLSRGCCSRHVLDDFVFTNALHLLHLLLGHLLLVVDFVMPTSSRLFLWVFLFVCF